jgi:hypothetical protein
MKSFRSLIGMLVITTATPHAWSATISGVATPLGNNKFRINVNLDTNTAAPTIVSFDLTFQAIGGFSLLNTLGFGQPQLLGSLANIPDQFDPNYSKTTDSWLDDELQPDGSRMGFVVIQPTEGPNLLRGGLATDVTADPPQSFQKGRIAHLYVEAIPGLGGSLRVTGSVAVGNSAAQAINYFLPNWPEPASLHLAALGLLFSAASRRGRLLRQAA